MVHQIQLILKVAKMQASSMVANHQPSPAGCTLLGIKGLASSPFSGHTGELPPLGCLLGDFPIFGF